MQQISIVAFRPSAHAPRGHCSLRDSPFPACLPLLDQAPRTTLLLYQRREAMSVLCWGGMASLVVSRTEQDKP